MRRWGLAADVGDQTARQQHGVEDRFGARAAARVRHDDPDLHRTGARTAVVLVESQSEGDRSRPADATRRPASRGRLLSRGELLEVVAVRSSSSRVVSRSSFLLVVQIEIHVAASQSGIDDAMMLRCTSLDPL